MYKAIQTKLQPRSRRYSSITPYKGENQRVFEGLLKSDNAIRITNYIPYSEGRLIRRKGLRLSFEHVDGNPILLLDRYTSNTQIFCHGAKTTIYNEDTETQTDIKTDWTASGRYSGFRYGDYYFLTNGVEKPHRVSRTLAYDGQTGNFATGLVVTGGISGATATILEDSDGGGAGTLTLGDISGTFVDNETITDSATGSATVNGTLGYAVTAISGAPMCEVLFGAGNRAYAGNLSTDPTAVAYSEADVGTNPPFSTWTVATSATGGGLVNYRRAGPVNDIFSIGEIIGVVSDYGKWAFRIDQIDVGGTLTKVDTVISDKLDLGGSKALSTDKGVLIVNESGVHVTVALAQPDTPFSEQDFNISTILGKDYFTNVDFDGSSIVYDRMEEIAYISCKSDSSTNNYVFGYNFQNKGFFRFSGWSIGTFFQDSDAKVYGGSAVDGKVYECFNGYTDDGLAIGTEAVWEITTDNTSYNDLEKFSIQAELSQSSQVRFIFDTFRSNGQKVDNRGTFLLTAQYSNPAPLGYGISPFASGFGSTISGSLDGTLPVYDSIKPGIRNFQRIQVRVTSSDLVPHALNVFTSDIRTKAQIRQRTITQI